MYELIELLEIKLPIQEKIGLTVVDGEFSSLLPRGDMGAFTLGHVKESVLKSIVSNVLDAKINSFNKTSNAQKILDKGIEDFPFLNEAEILRSIFVTRVVKVDVEESDERPTEVTDCGNGVYSIFAGKVITCIDTAKEIARMIGKS